MMGHVYQTLYYLANLIFYKIFFNAVELLSVQRQQCPIHKGALDTSIWLNMLKILSSIHKGALDTSIWLNMLKILSFFSGLKVFILIIAIRFLPVEIRKRNQATIENNQFFQL